VFGRLEFSSRVRSLVQVLSQRADVTTLRGLLALEVGEAAEAEAAFRLALSYWDADTRTGVDFNGRVIARDGLDWLTAARARTVTSPAAGAGPTSTVRGR
jgi:hypothetical protein